LAAVDKDRATVQKTYADYDAVMTEYIDVIDSFPPEIAQIALMADSPAEALYVLAKEGQIESLVTMHPIQAAMTIAQAQVRAAQYKAKPISKAPAPVKGLSGATGGAKTIHDLSVDELIKRFR